MEHSFLSLVTAGEKKSVKDFKPFEYENTFAAL